MEKLSWIIISLIIIALIGIFAIKMPTNIPNNSEQPTSECNTNSDCMPAQCCHPYSCVSIKDKLDCSGIACTAHCEPGTMDCGCGHCVCINNKCEVVWTKTHEWC